MKFTLNWLKEHLETESDLQEIADRLTNIGLEVEEIIDNSDLLAPFVVAEVLEVKKHPNADKLKICMVNTGSDTVQVVCGAPNAKAGMKGVFAPPGSLIPGSNMSLKSAKIRGVESHGMLCSESELMLSDEHEGIIELAGDAPVGTAFTEFAGLNDPIIHVAITPNRQDCLGVSGIARDLAAAGMGKVKDRKPKPVEGKFKCPIEVTLELDKDHGDACLAFAGRLIKDIKNGPSPRWLQDKLRAIGLRPISALVDITNFITFDRGRPLHVYDVAKLTGAVRVRLAKEGEKFQGLDGKSYTLSAEDCVIADDRGVQDLGGVMGGELSGCSDNTTDVFVECAIFDPVRTTMTGRRLGIESDARYRFERGVDPEFILPGIELATGLILDLCGGQASEVILAGKIPTPEKKILFRPERVKSLGGIDLGAKECLNILTSLGYKYQPVKNKYEILVPSWRSDVVGEADLVEDILRIYGYDKIPAVRLSDISGVGKKTLTTQQIRARAVKRRLAAEGLFECISWSFIPSFQARLFSGGNDILKIENPISSDLDVMRPTIIPNLITAADNNAVRGATSIALFEVGPQYESTEPDGQKMVAAGIRAGQKNRRHWKHASREIDLYDAKSDALAALDAASAPIEKLVTMGDAPSWYHPGRSGTIRLSPKTILANFGEIHPGILKKMGVQAPMTGFEVFLDNIPKSRKSGHPTKPPLEASNLQSVARDFAFLVERSVSADAILTAARTADKTFIKEVRIFDLFEGTGLKPGQKSIAISVVMEPAEKTMTDSEIDSISDRIVAAVCKSTGATLRN